MVATLNQIHSGHQLDYLKSQLFDPSSNLLSTTVCSAVSDFWRCSVKSDYDMPLMYFFFLGNKYNSTLTQRLFYSLQPHFTVLSHKRLLLFQGVDDLQHVEPITAALFCMPAQYMLTSLFGCTCKWANGPSTPSHQLAKASLKSSKQVYMTALGLCCHNRVLILIHLLHWMDVEVQEELC